MAWTKLDDRFWSHPKIAGLSNQAFRLYVVSLNWSVSHLTDGHVPASCLPLFRVRGRSAANELLNCGLWKPHDLDGYMIHDFAEYQPTKESVRIDRKSNARRQALWRDSDLKNRVRNRDQNRCRYCGSEVNWSDRRSPVGATYDHVDPDGENTVDNLVVACRSCNSKKGARLPSEAGMNLLPTRTEPEQNQNITSYEQSPDPTRPDIDTPNGVSRTETQQSHDAVVAALIGVHGEPATEREWGKYHDTAKRLRDGQVKPDEYPRLVDAFRLKHGEGASFGVATVSNRIGELRHHLLKSERAREPVVVDPESCRHMNLADIGDGVFVCAACGTQLEDGAA